MSGTIVYVARQGPTVVGVLRVPADTTQPGVELVATVPGVDGAGNALSPAQVKAALVDAWRLQAQAQHVPPVEITGAYVGTVNL